MRLKWWLPRGFTDVAPYETIHVGNSSDDEVTVRVGGWLLNSAHQAGTSYVWSYACLTLLKKHLRVGRFVCERTLGMCPADAERWFECTDETHEAGQVADWTLFLWVSCSSRGLETFCRIQLSRQWKLTTEAAAPVPSPICRVLVRCSRMLQFPLLC